MQQDKHITSNRKAAFDYHIVDTFTAGIVLKGCEIKSIRNHQCSLVGSYAVVKNDEVFLIGMHIDQYKEVTDPIRTRKLLLNKKEIRELKSISDRDGYTIIPLEVIIRNGFAKIVIGVAIGKKQHDKRNSLKSKEAAKDIKREQ